LLARLAASLLQCLVVMLLQESDSFVSGVRISGSNVRINQTMDGLQDEGESLLQQESRKRLRKAIRTYRFESRFLDSLSSDF
jgi:hypothetical protein